MNCQDHALPLSARLRACATAVLLVLSVASCAGKEVLTETSPASVQPQFSGLHPLAQAVAQAGAPQCAPRVHEAAIYLILDTESGAMLHAHSEDLYSFSLEVIDPVGITSYVSLNVAPGENAACAISYEIVTPLGHECALLAEQAWPGATAGSPLRKQILPLAIGDGQIVLLHPVGDSCIVIRKEIIP